MARVVFHSMAHRGDVYPYVPIASELRRRGHEVTYVVPREFHETFRDEPFRCVHSGTDFGPAELDRHGPYLARWGMRMGGVMVLRLYFGEFTIPHLDALFEAVDAEVASADLVFPHPAASMVSAMSCERRGVPWIVGDLFPMLLRNEEEPPMPGVPNLGAATNRRLWGLSGWSGFDRITSAEGFRSFRRGLGLPVPDGWNVIDARLSPHGNLGLVPSAYVAPKVGWPEPYELVGFSNWSGPGEGRLPADVEEFLGAGDPPVIVTLGTSGASARPELFERAAEALDAAGGRGLFLVSNPENEARLRAAGVGSPHGIWPFVPLAPLLPRARGIVHSGAHGTNALALEAGLASVIVPCLFDQLWHARRQAELGTGLHVRRPSALGNAVQRLLDDDGLRERAEELAPAIRSQDGTTAAADRIEAFLAAG
jgi:rhamnosyltransferase subunit B